MENRVLLTQTFEVSRIIHGHWRLADWKLSNQELLKFIEQAIEIGITTFDHADIYGDYSCEKLFGKALHLNKEIRKNIQLITKCGIKLISNKFPDRKYKYYDYSYQHIIRSVDLSLKNFNTDYIDLLLLHRPSPFFNPMEVSKAVTQLIENGKVLHFGVSNFNPEQFEMLNSYLDYKLVTNQVEISPACLEHFENGNIDYFLKERIKPMAWSPLDRGQLLFPKTIKEKRIYKCLTEVANELNENSLDKVIYSWLLSHPATIVPVVGSGNISRLKRAVDSLNINMNTEQWLRIYVASTGVNLP